MKIKSDWDESMELAHDREIQAKIGEGSKEFYNATQANS